MTIVQNGEDKATLFVNNFWNDTFYSNEERRVRVQVREVSGKEDQLKEFSPLSEVVYSDSYSKSKWDN